MKEKDPYLSELDELEDLEGNNEQGGEEPTRVDIQIPPTEAEPSPTAGSSKDVLGLAPDIPVEVVAVFGRKTVTVRDLLDFRTGSVVELDKTPAEPVDLVAGGRLIAKGELVEVDGKLGVRILKLMK